MFPHIKNRCSERLENKWNQCISRNQGKLVLEFVSSFNGSGDILCITDLINEFEETLDVFVADRVDSELCSKCIKRNADFEDGTNLLITRPPL